MEAVATRIAARPWAVSALCVVAGAVLALAQPPIGAWPALVLGWPVLLRLVAAAPGPRSAALRGFLAGLGFFATGIHWIGEAFLVEASKVWWYAPVMPFAVGALAALCAAFWAAGFALARRIAAPGWRGAVVLGAAMAFAEGLRGVLPTGFPWALQAYAWIDTPAMQAAALTGSLALTGLTGALAALPGAAAPRRLGPALAALALLALLWGGGASRLAGAEVAAEGPPIRLVQPNTRQVDKWAPENRRRIFETLLELTADPASEPPALVVWPEVAVTFLLDAAPEAVARATRAAGEASLAAGAVRRAESGALYNSLLFYGPDGAPLGVYDKRKLTPFGEYVPFAWILGRIGLGTLGDGLSGFAHGRRVGPYDLPGLPPAAPLICYEIIFPGLVGESATGAGWILQVTNDAWFGDSAGPWQHLAQARARAIEQGLPVARAANTGISAFIDPYGRVTASLPLDLRGALDSPLPGAPVATLYARTGDAPWLALMAIAALAARPRREPAPA